MVEIVMGSNLLDDVVAWVRVQSAGGTVAIVCDDHTYDAAAKTIYEALEADKPKLIRLGKRVLASKDTGDALIVQTHSASVLLVVGSGTLNDLAKYAAHAQNKRYAIVATAPSMNGYVSSTASLAVGRHKTSLPAMQPHTLFVDLNIICKSPAKMIRAGLGDSICRPTVQADQLIAHHVMGKPYDIEVFEPLITLETELLANLKHLSEKDPAMMTLLMELLIASGQAMHTMGSSAPASQGEHMIAHAVEMLYPGTTHALHGEQIAVTTSTMANLQEKLLHKRPTIKPNSVKPERFRTLFGKELGATLHEQYQSKLITQERADELNAKLESRWEFIAEEIRGVMLGASSIELVIKKMNGSIRYADIGWSKDRYEHAVSHAYMTRDRFTFLDLMAMNKNLRAWF